MKKIRSCLILKTDLGKVKTGFHILPPPHHTFGKSPLPDKYGARQVVNSWCQYKPSPAKRPEKDYIAMNKQGLLFGCTKTQHHSAFRKMNERRRKIREGKKLNNIKVFGQQFAFGIKNRPSTPIKSVICNVYGNEEIQYQRERSQILKTIRMHNKSQRYDISSQQKFGNKTSRVSSNRDHSFKLSRFKNIPSKIHYLLNRSQSSKIGFKSEKQNHSFVNNA